MSRKNPYFASGKNFTGVGYEYASVHRSTRWTDILCAPSGPHANVYNPWPMSLISVIYGSDNDKEILNALYQIANVSSGLLSLLRRST